MKQASEEEVKSILLGILECFADFCEKNDLTYYLAYGTLLGAVRHNGFIPWDDDIDVIMPRPDYLKFLELTKGVLNDYLKVYSAKNNTGYIYPYAKIVNQNTVLIENDIRGEFTKLGVYIDVFPIDGLPETKNRIYIHYLMISFLNKCLWASVTSNVRWRGFIETKIKRNIVKLCSLYGYTRIVNLVEKISQRYDYKKSNNVGVVVWGLGIREVRSKTDFTESTLLEFEKKFFKAPADYKNYLTQLYGNYMKLPPIEKRKSNHNTTIYKK